MNDEADTSADTGALEGADRDGLAAVAILVMTVIFIVVVLIALIG